LSGHTNPLKLKVNNDLVGTVFYDGLLVAASHFNKESQFLEHCVFALMDGKEFSEQGLRSQVGEFGIRHEYNEAKKDQLRLDLRKSAITLRGRKFLSFDIDPRDRDVQEGEWLVILCERRKPGEATRFTAQLKSKSEIAKIEERVIVAGLPLHIEQFPLAECGANKAKLQACCNGLDELINSAKTSEDWSGLYPDSYPIRIEATRLKRFIDAAIESNDYATVAFAYRLKEMSLILGEILPEEKESEVATTGESDDDTKEEVGEAAKEGGNAAKQESKAVVVEQPRNELHEVIDVIDRAKRHMLGRGRATFTVTIEDKDTELQLVDRFERKENQLIIGPIKTTKRSFIVFITDQPFDGELQVTNLAKDPPDTKPFKGSEITNSYVGNGPPYAYYADVRDSTQTEEAHLEIARNMRTAFLYKLPDVSTEDSADGGGE